MPVRKTKTVPKKKVIKKPKTIKETDRERIYRSEMEGGYLGDYMSEQRNMEDRNPERPENVIISQSQDHFYYNTIINNSTDNVVPAIYKDVRSDAILQNPEDYTLSIVRFSLSSGVLPIFNFKPLPGSKTTGNQDLNLGKYSVTLSYNGVDVQQYLTFILNRLNPNAPQTNKDNVNWNYNNPPNLSDWLTINSSNYNYYQVFDYQNFLDMINAALFTAYMKVDPNSPPKLAGAPAPFMQLNHTTGLISLMVHRTFNVGYAGSPTIEISMNNDLYMFFNNFSTIYTKQSGSSGKDYIFRIRDFGNNLVVQQEETNYFIPWYSYTTYQNGDLVNAQNAIGTRTNYRSLSNANINFDPASNPSKWREQDAGWDNFASYQMNESVLYFGSRYISMTNGNVGHLPDSTNFWKLTTPSSIPSMWLSQTSYSKNNVVNYKNNWYISLQNSNVNKNPEGIIYPQWISSQTYNIGDLTSYAGTNYASITNSNTNNAPITNPSNWSIIQEYWAPYTGYNLYDISQEYQSLYNWNDLVSIVFTTSQLPIVQEYIPIQGQSTQQSSNVSESSRQILTDFSIGSSTGFDIKEPIVYTSQGEYRLINLLSNTPLRKTDIEIHWTDQANNLYPIMIAAGGKSCATIKSLFRKKHYK